MNKKTDIDLLIDFAHRGAVESARDAQERIMLLQTFEVNAVAMPVLHQFDPAKKTGELSWETQLSRYRDQLARAIHVGMLCEKYKNKVTDELMKSFVDGLRRRKD